MISRGTATPALCKALTASEKVSANWLKTRLQGVKAVIFLGAVILMAAGILLSAGISQAGIPITLYRSFAGDIDFTIPQCVNTIDKTVALIKENRAAWLASQKKRSRSSRKG